MANLTPDPDAVLAQVRGVVQLSHELLEQLRQNNADNVLTEATVLQWVERGRLLQQLAIHLTPQQLTAWRPEQRQPLQHLLEELQTVDQACAPLLQAYQRQVGQQLRQARGNRHSGQAYKQPPHTVLTARGEA